jgi:hypothetical protein
VVPADRSRVPKIICGPGYFQCQLIGRTHLATVCAAVQRSLRTAGPRLRLGHLTRPGESVRFHANYVSTSVSGDYYQAMFAAEQDSDGVDGPYLLIQRQFEDPDDDWCYIETHDKNYIGHFHLRRVEFTPQNLSIEFDRPADNLVSVTFAMAASDFEEASRVVKIIGGEIELP